MNLELSAKTWNALVSHIVYCENRNEGNPRPWNENLTDVMRVERKAKELAWELLQEGIDRLYIPECDGEDNCKRYSDVWGDEYCERYAIGLCRSHEY